MLTRATSIYLSMLGVFAVGLWGILSVGSTFLHAPSDLSGDWTLHPAEASMGNAGTQKMKIEQSGYFLRIHFPDREVSLKVQSEQALKQRPGTEIRLAGDGVEMLLMGSADTDQMHVESRGSISGLWTAVRVARRYPGRGAHPPTSRPS